MGFWDLLKMEKVNPVKRDQKFISLVSIENLNLLETLQALNSKDPFSSYRDALTLPDNFIYGMNCDLDRLAELYGDLFAQIVYEEIKKDPGNFLIDKSASEEDIKDVPILFRVSQQVCLDWENKLLLVFQKAQCDPEPESGYHLKDLIKNLYEIFSEKQIPLEAYPIYFKIKLDKFKLFSRYKFSGDILLDSQIIYKSKLGDYYNFVLLQKFDEENAYDDAFGIYKRKVPFSYCIDKSDELILQTNRKIKEILFGEEIELSDEAISKIFLVYKFKPITQTIRNYLDHKEGINYQGLPTRNVNSAKINSLTKNGTKFISLVSSEMFDLLQEKIKKNGADPFKEYRNAKTLPETFIYGMNCYVDRLAESEGDLFAQMAYEEIKKDPGNYVIDKSARGEDIKDTPVLFGVTLYAGLEAENKLRPVFRKVHAEPEPELVYPLKDVAKVFNEVYQEGHVSLTDYQIYFKVKLNKFKKFAANLPTNCAIIYKSKMGDYYNFVLLQESDDEYVYGSYGNHKRKIPFSYCVDESNELILQAPQKIKTVFFKNEIMLSEEDISKMMFVYQYKSIDQTIRTLFDFQEGKIPIIARVFEIFLRGRRFFRGV